MADHGPYFNANFAADADSDGCGFRCAGRGDRYGLKVLTNVSSSTHL